MSITWLLPDEEESNAEAELPPLPVPRATFEGFQANWLADHERSVRGEEMAAPDCPRCSIAC